MAAWYEERYETHAGKPNGDQGAAAAVPVTMEPNVGDSSDTEQQSLSGSTDCSVLFAWLKSRSRRYPK
jgi:hypothetical protein